MSAFTGQHDAFREELKTKYKQNINILVPTINGMTTDRAVDLLIRSIEKVKNGTEPQDSPTWKVAKFIHDGNFKDIKERRGLAPRIAEKTGLKDSMVRSILSRYDFNLPSHLKFSKKYPEKEVFDRPSFKEPEPPKTDETTQVYEIKKGGKIDEIVIRTGNIEITLRMK